MRDRGLLTTYVSLEAELTPSLEPSDEVTVLLNGLTEASGEFWTQTTGLTCSCFLTKRNLL